MNKKNEALRMFSVVQSTRKSFRSFIVNSIKRYLLPSVALVALLVVIPTVAADASPLLQPKTEDINNFFGCYDVSWLTGVASTSKSLTSKLFGLVFIIAVFVFAFSGISMMLAGRRVDKAQDAILSMKHVGQGLLLIAIALPVGLVLLPAIGRGYC